ncbi:hypothetical protein [Risungbinella massiliensis]|uniref:hypothetical protein n=1 Tax=Risungbinella massiliensis TaxID=1329796 RepID=UPI0005CC11F8|nr:hypothetical protein [Risungbinella massiliensis]
MKIGSLAKLIQNHQERFDAAFKKGNSVDCVVELSKVLKLFLKECRELNNVEEEIVQYFQYGLEKRDLGKYSRMWFGSALEHPSSSYIPYLVKIAEDPEPTFPHWLAFDTLAYLPESITESCVPDLIKMMDGRNPNPSWSEDVIYKYFETLNWIGTEEAINFIKKAQKHSNSTVAKIAVGYVQQFELDEEDPE